MSSAPAIVHTEREQWLRRRRELVTASDVAAILGEDERRGPLAVYAEKVGAVEVEETEAMARGRDFEEAIARAYARQTGRSVSALHEYEIQIHPSIPWLGATLDRVTIPDCNPLQIKLAIGSAREWKETPPTGYVIQVQIEIACYDAPWGALAGLVGPGPLAVSDHARDDEFLALALPKLEEFRRCVQRREPPEADHKPGTTAAVKRLWRTVGRETVALDHDSLVLAHQLDFHKARGAHHAEQAQRIENELRARVGDAAYGALPDGSFLRRTRGSRAGYTVGPAEWVQLDRYYPKVRAR